MAIEKFQNLMGNELLISVWKKNPLTGLSRKSNKQILQTVPSQIFPASPWLKDLVH